VKRRLGQLYWAALSVIFVLSLIPLTSVDAASIIYVPDRYPTIQAAVDAANTGDTILVGDGTYTENVKVNKSVAIKSENGKEATIIQAANPDTKVFLVTADNVRIDGFTIKGASNSHGIALIQVTGCTIANNNILNNMWGISLTESSNNIISNNRISGNDCGIDLSSSNNIIYKNYIVGNDTAIDTSFSFDVNTIYLNDFINNTRNAFNRYSKQSAIIWHSSEQISYIYKDETFRSYLGNYWRDYTGTDSSGDGIGDTPHNINSDEDSYPLMDPFESYKIPSTSPESPSNINQVSTPSESPPKATEPPSSVSQVSATQIPSNILPIIIIFCFIALIIFLVVRFYQWRLRKRDELFERVCKAIEKYEPPPRHSTIEIAYHWALFEYLRNKFPSNKVGLETRTEDGARPDITIDHIAIEVKGPTGANDLDTLIAKCWKFSQHYKNIIFVLFAPKYRPQKLDQVKAEIRKRYPEITARFISK